MVFLAPRVDVWTPALQRVNSLGADLAAARARLKLTTAHQAKAIGITTATLVGLVEGTSNPTRATIAASLSWLARVR